MSLVFREGFHCHALHSESNQSNASELQLTSVWGTGKNFKSEGQRELGGGGEKKAGEGGCSILYKQQG